jgi:hypothetical protein
LDVNDDYNDAINIHLDSDQGGCACWTIQIPPTRWMSQFICLWVLPNCNLQFPHCFLLVSNT